MQEDLNIISKLDDEPNDHQGLTPAQLKARFDMAGNAIKAYLNGTLLPEMERAIDHIDTSGFVPAERTVCGKPLSEDITLTAHDVGALPAGTPIPSALADLNEDSMHRTVTDAEKAAWNAKSNLALGETSTTAYRGDRGKIAYDHSRATGNPHGATPADIGAAEAAHTHTASEVAGLDQLLAGAVKIETGTYIGTGAYGETRPNSLTFSFEPKFVFVGCAFKTSAPYFPARVIGTFMVRPCMVSSNILSIQTYSITTATYNFVTWSGNTVSWHCRPDVNQQLAAGVQLNESEVEYHYFAIG